jgi:hypothetical protein
VVDDHDPTSGQRPGEGHPPAQRRPDRLTRDAREIDTAMPAAEREIGRLEGSNHGRPRLQRPHPHRNRGHGCTARAGWPRQGDEHGQHDKDDDGRHTTVDPDRVGVKDLHAVTLPTGTGRSRAAESGLWTASYRP